MRSEALARILGFHRTRTPAWLLHGDGYKGRVLFSLIQWINNRGRAVGFDGQLLEMIFCLAKHCGDRFIRREGNVKKWH